MQQPTGPSEGSRPASTAPLALAAAFHVVVLRVLHTDELAFMFEPFRARL
jgi:hypothetical protein